MPAHDTDDSDESIKDKRNTDVTMIINTNPHVFIVALKRIEALILHLKANFYFVQSPDLLNKVLKMWPI